MFKNKTSLFFLFFLVIVTVSNCQEGIKTTDSLAIALSQLNDGPYVFIEENQLIEKNIIKGEVITKTLKADVFSSKFPPDPVEFKDIKKIAAFSDLHGQYDLAVELLINNNIIDEDLNWNFGKGHLVIVGDIFDRGPQVNEILWLIFKLEQQAIDNGGRVHYLLGNHEYMVLHGDLRYIHEKYTLTEKLLDKEYQELYGNSTVLGRWLRSKNTIVRINDNVFVHGGVSKKFMENNDFSLKIINDIMRNSIERSKKDMKESDFYKTYYGKKSLIWYRGYFNDDLKEEEIDEILEIVDTDHVVVGHCSNKKVVQLYHQKIFGVDSSIKKGKYGEILWIKNDHYSRRTLEGKKKEFKEKEKAKK